MVIPWGGLDEGLSVVRSLKRMIQIAGEPSWWILGKPTDTSIAHLLNFCYQQYKRSKIPKRCSPFGKLELEERVSRHSEVSLKWLSHARRQGVTCGGRRRWKQTCLLPSLTFSLHKLCTNPQQGSLISRVLGSFNPPSSATSDMAATDPMVGFYF